MLENTSGVTRSLHCSSLKPHNNWPREAACVLVKGLEGVMRFTVMNSWVRLRTAESEDCKILPKKEMPSMFFLSMSNSSESKVAIAGSKFLSWNIISRLMGCMLAPCRLVTLLFTAFQIFLVTDCGQGILPKVFRQLVTSLLDMVEM